MTVFFDQNTENLENASFERLAAHRSSIVDQRIRHAREEIQQFFFKTVHTKDLKEHQ